MRSLGAIKRAGKSLSELLLDTLLGERVCKNRPKRSTQPLFEKVAQHLQLKSISKTLKRGLLAGPRVLILHLLHFSHDYHFSNSYFRDVVKH